MVKSAYIHIPFCLSKCRYCSFVSFDTVSKKTGYLYSLLKEIDYYYKGELIVEECSAFRMIVNLHDRISLTCHPLGASSNEDDVNYTSQMDMYQKNSYRKLKTMDNYKQYIKGYSI